MKKEYLLYIIRNNINSKVYAGKHIGYRTDNYMGSGYRLKDAIKKYGIENFERRYLKLNIDSNEELDRLEIRLIRLLKYIFGNNCYNIHVGGTGGYLLHHASKNFRKEVSKRISKGKIKQYANGETEAQKMGRIKANETKRFKMENDPEYAKRITESNRKAGKKCIELYGTEMTKKATKKLTTFGQFQIKYQIIYPDGRIEEKQNRYSDFSKATKMQEDVYTFIHKGNDFTVKRRTKMTPHDYPVGTIFRFVEEITDENPLD